MVILETETGGRWAFNALNAGKRCFCCLFL